MAQIKTHLDHGRKGDREMSDNETRSGVTKYFTNVNSPSVYRQVQFETGTTCFVKGAFNYSNPGYKYTTAELSDA